MEARISTAHIDRLWERMTMLYGHKWTSSVGDCDDGTWMAGLHDITAQMIADGLERIIKGGNDWPPSLPEFRKICENKEITTNEHGLNYVPQIYREEKPIDAKQLETDRTGHMTASSETVSTSLAAIRGFLRGART